jgi:hypothetical protein
MTARYRYPLPEQLERASMAQMLARKLTLPALVES